MLVHTAHLTCRPDAIAQFKDRLLRHAKLTLEAEPDCHLFAVHQDTSEPARFLLVEHYTDEAALQHHRQSPHFLAFREDTKDWVVNREWWFWTPLN
jgi:(4S)-4-hydroxy-5-phosphonooxypentane-2,3-dione isomerase